MAKQILYNKDARDALKRGVDKVANAVKVTHGPRGSNGILENPFGSPVITNAGSVIAGEIILKDKFENMGAEITKRAAMKTHKKAGDGTTGTVIMLQFMVGKGFKYVNKGVNAMGIKRGMDTMAGFVVTLLSDISENITEKEKIRQVATISSESKDMGRIIANTIDKVGINGVVTVEESQTFGISSTFVEGLEFDKGYVSHYMVTDKDRDEAVYENVSVLVTDQRITVYKNIEPLLVKLIKEGKTDLVIIADDIDGTALNNFVLNTMKGNFNILAIKAPGFADGKKDLLEDIAATVGAEVITKGSGMKFKDVELSKLGKVDKIVSDDEKTIVIGDKENALRIVGRVEQLKAQMKDNTNSIEVKKLELRIAKLTGGVAIIKVGAATEQEMEYKKFKIRDAVNATKAAIEEGIVAGGGSAIIRIAEMARSMKSLSKEEKIGFEIVFKALETPLKQIIINSGKKVKGSWLSRLFPFWFKDNSIFGKIKRMSKNGGYDALNNRLVNDMIFEGIIDPTKVIRNEIQNSVSAAGTLLTTEVAVVEETNNNK